MPSPYYRKKDGDAEPRADAASAAVAERKSAAEGDSECKKPSASPNATSTSPHAKVERKPEQARGKRSTKKGSSKSNASNTTAEKEKQTGGVSSSQTSGAYAYRGYQHYGYGRSSKGGGKYNSYSSRNQKGGADHYKEKKHHSGTDDGAASADEKQTTEKETTTSPKVKGKLVVCSSPTSPKKAERETKLKKASASSPARQDEEAQGASASDCKWSKVRESFVMKAESKTVAAVPAAKATPGKQNKHKLTPKLATIEEDAELVVAACAPAASSCASGAGAATRDSAGTAAGASSSSSKPARATHSKSFSQESYDRWNKYNDSCYASTSSKSSNTSKHRTSSKGGKTHTNYGSYGTSTVSAADAVAEQKESASRADRGYYGSKWSKSSRSYDEGMSREAVGSKSLSHKGGAKGSKFARKHYEFYPSLNVGASAAEDVTKEEISAGKGLLLDEVERKGARWECAMPEKMSAQPLRRRPSSVEKHDEERDEDEQTNPIATPSKRAEHTGEAKFEDSLILASPDCATAKKQASSPGAGAEMNVAPQNVSSEFLQMASRMQMPTTANFGTDSCSKKASSNSTESSDGGATSAANTSENFSSSFRLSESMLGPAEAKLSASALADAIIGRPATPEKEKLMKRAAFLKEQMRLLEAEERHQKRQAIESGAASQDRPTSSGECSGVGGASSDGAFTVRQETAGYKNSARTGTAAVDDFRQGAEVSRETSDEHAAETVLNPNAAVFVPQANMQVVPVSKWSPRPSGSDLATDADIAYYFGSDCSEDEDSTPFQTPTNSVSQPPGPPALSTVVDEVDCPAVSPEPDRCVEAAATSSNQQSDLPDEISSCSPSPPAAGSCKDSDPLRLPADESTRISATPGSSSSSCSSESVTSETADLEMDSLLRQFDSTGPLLVQQSVAAEEGTTAPEPVIAASPPRAAEDAAQPGDMSLLNMTPIDIMTPHANKSLGDSALLRSGSSFQLSTSRKLNASAFAFTPLLNGSSILEQSVVSEVESPPLDRDVPSPDLAEQAEAPKSIDPNQTLESGLLSGTEQDIVLDSLSLSQSCVTDQSALVAKMPQHDSEGAALEQHPDRQVTDEFQHPELLVDMELAEVVDEDVHRTLPTLQTPFPTLADFFARKQSQVPFNLDAYSDSDSSGDEGYIPLGQSGTSSSAEAASSSATTTTASSSVGDGVSQLVACASNADAAPPPADQGSYASDDGQILAAPVPARCIPAGQQGEQAETTAPPACVEVPDELPESEWDIVHCRDGSAEAAERSMIKTLCEYYVDDGDTDALVEDYLALPTDSVRGCVRHFLCLGADDSQKAVSVLKTMRALLRERLLRWEADIRDEAEIFKRHFQPHFELDNPKVGAFLAEVDEFAGIEEQILNPRARGIVPLNAHLERSTSSSDTDLTEQGTERMDSPDFLLETPSLVGSSSGTLPSDKSRTPSVPGTPEKRLEAPRMVPDSPAEKQVFRIAPLSDEAVKKKRYTRAELLQFQPVFVGVEGAAAWGILTYDEIKSASSSGLKPSSGGWRSAAATAQAAKAGSKAGNAANARGGTSRGGAGNLKKAEVAKMMKASSTSWVKQLGSHGAKKDALKSDEAAASERKMQALLNKLTFEKFESVTTQMMELLAGLADLTAGIPKLIAMLFQIATTQHHFVSLYTQLCQRIHAWLEQRESDANGKKATSDAEAGTTTGAPVEASAAPVPPTPATAHSFKRALLNQCQASFEEYLTPDLEFEHLSGEQLFAAQLKYKTKMVGNIKLVGELIRARMIASRISICICADLLANGQKTHSPGAAANLETLVAFLESIGPMLDKHLEQMFVAVKALSKDKSVPARIRCLLQDVLDLRDSEWVNHKKAKAKLEKATTLKEVQTADAAAGGDKKAGSGGCASSPEKSGRGSRRGGDKKGGKVEKDKVWGASGNVLQDPKLRELEATLGSAFERVESEATASLRRAHDCLLSLATCFTAMYAKKLAPRTENDAAEVIACLIQKVVTGYPDSVSMRRIQLKFVCMLCVAGIFSAGKEGGSLNKAAAGKVGKDELLNRALDRVKLRKEENVLLEKELFPIIDECFYGYVEGADEGGDGAAGGKKK